MQTELLSRYAPPTNPNWDLWMLVGARGDGKTYSALKALPEAQDSIVVAPNVEHARWCAEEFVKQRKDDVLAYRRTAETVQLFGGGCVKFCSHSDFRHDRSRFFGQRFATAILDEVGLYPDVADDIAGFLRMTCRVERIITTSARW